MLGLPVGPLIAALIPASFGWLAHGAGEVKVVVTYGLTFAAAWQATDDAGRTAITATLASGGVTYSPAIAVSLSAANIANMMPAVALLGDLLAQTGAINAGLSGHIVSSDGVTVGGPVLATLATVTPESLIAGSGSADYLALARAIEMRLSSAHEQGYEFGEAMTVALEPAPAPAAAGGATEETLDAVARASRPQQVFVSLRPGCWSPVAYASHSWAHRPGCQ